MQNMVTTCALPEHAYPLPKGAGRNGRSTVGCLTQYTQNCVPRHKGSYIFDFGAPAHSWGSLMQGEVEQISMMKPKAEDKNDTGLLEYLEVGAKSKTNLKSAPCQLGVCQCWLRPPRHTRLSFTTVMTPQCLILLRWRAGHHWD